MAKVKFFLNSNANHQSTNESDVFDTVDDLGLEPGEWESMDDGMKYKEIREWANNYLEMWYEEIPEDSIDT